MTTENQVKQVFQNAISPLGSIGFLKVNKARDNPLFLTKTILDVCIKLNEVVESVSTFSKITLYFRRLFIIRFVLLTQLVKDIGLTSIPSLSQSIVKFSNRKFFITIKYTQGINSAVFLYCKHKLLHISSKEF